MRVAASKLELVISRFVLKELTHDSDPQPQFYRFDLASALPRFRVEQRSMETGLHHRPWSGRPSGVGAGWRQGTGPGGDRSRQAPVQSSLKRGGLLLLRGRARRLLAPSLLASEWYQ